MRKKLKTEMLESVTSFLRHRLCRTNLMAWSNTWSSIFKKCVQLKTKTKLCRQICACKDNRHTYCAKRKIASCDARHYSYSNHNDWHCYIYRDWNHNNEHLLVKHFCNENSPHDRKYNCHNNQTKKWAMEKVVSLARYCCAPSIPS